MTTKQATVNLEHQLIVAQRGRVLAITRDKEHANRVAQTAKMATGRQTIVKKLWDEIIHTDELKEVATLFGNTFFTPERMKHFRTEVLEPVWGSRYFITRETTWGRSAYTIRQFRIDTDPPTMRINVVDGQTFMGWQNLEDVEREARRLAKLLKKNS